MIYIEKTNKSVEETISLMQEKISNYKFGILHIHNIKETLISKGVDFKEECQVLDVCNPNFANELLSNDMNISTIMPCKISVYSKNNETFIAMNSIAQLIDDINPDLIEKAYEIQEILLEFIEEVK